MNCAALPLIGMALLCFGGCVYTSSGGYLTAAEGYGSPTSPPPVWDESAKALRQDFPARCYYHRRGVYPEGTKLTPGGAHWGVVGDMIEGLAHLPTFWLEMLLWADRESYYDVVFLDRNSKRGDIELLALPDCAFDDRLLRQEAFRPYWTNTVFGIDFDEGEKIFAMKDRSSREEPSAVRIAYSNKLMAYRDKLEDARPVLWWKDSSGQESLLVFQRLRKPPAQGCSLGEPFEYRLLYFRNFGFVRTFDFEKTDERLSAKDYVFSTLDGRFVNILGGSPWFRQIDLLTGDDRRVGGSGALDNGEVNGGLEVRAEPRPVM